MMSLSVLCRKDIINISTGKNIGRRDDIEFDEIGAKVKNIIVYGRPKFFGIFGKHKDMRISWSDVVTIGSDVILINAPEMEESGKQGVIKLKYD